MIVSLRRNFQHLSAGKKSTSSFTFSSRYCKDIVNLLFPILWACLATHIQSDISSYRKLLFICRQNINFIPHAFKEILQRCANLFWVLWAWIVPLTQMVVSTCRRLQFLSACKKMNFLIDFFLEVLHFKESCNMIGWQHFGP